MKTTRLIGIGISFVIALVLFIWGLNYLKGINIFKNERMFYAKYQEVNGLEVANPVSINGVRIGQVSRIYFSPEMSGDVMVEILIHSDFPIPDNSVMRIYSSDLMGSKAIDLKLGNSKQLAVSGDTLQSTVEASLMEEVNAQVQPIKVKAENLLASIDSVVTYLKLIFNKDARQRINQSVANIEQTFANLQSTTSNLDTVVSQERNRIASIMMNIQTFSAALAENREEFSAVMNNLQTLTDSLSKSDIPGTFVQLNNATAQLDSILAQINSGDGTLGMLMYDDSLYLELTASARELNMLLNDLRLNPKRYVRFSLF